MEDKETDTMDDLQKIDYKYYLQGKSHKPKSSEKLRDDFQGQVETIPILDKDDLNKDKEDDEGDSILGSC